MCTYVSAATWDNVSRLDITKVPEMAMVPQTVATFLGRLLVEGFSAIAAWTMFGIKGTDRLDTAIRWPSKPKRRKRMIFGPSY